MFGSDAWLVLGALAFEACVGYPSWLYARIRHPVVWIGTLIAALERLWNDARFGAVRRRLLGVAAMIVIIACAGGVGFAIERSAIAYLDAAVVIVIASTGIAQRSLYVHVRDVLAALESRDLPMARTSVARIVGRDTAQLSDDEVAAAALESLAESFNDAVVAPVFWLLIGGLPGLFAYKAVNTADSMIGHMEERWRMFGWAAARLDDLMNLVPARIAGLLLATAALRGFGVMLRDASKHASPNAGWPEAALAGGLAIRLGGTAVYDGVAYERGVFGDGARPTTTDLRKGLHIYMRGCALLWVVIGTIALSSS